MTGLVTRSVATSHLVDRVANLHGLPVWMRDALFLRVGPIYSRRWDIPFPSDQRTLLAARLADPPSKIGEQNVTKIHRVDGSKLFFSDDSWVLLCPSGTEPIVRLYVETREEGEIETLARNVRQAFFG